MKTIVCLVTFTACLLAVSSTDSVGEVEKAFTTNEIDKDMLKPVPTQKLQIHYSKSKKIVNFGNELSPADVQDVPEVTYESDPKAFYTLSFSDPDAPSRKNPTRREYQHWLVVNIPGSDVSKGEVLSEYVGSAPPEGTGLHRYVFALFKQPGKIVFKEQKRTKAERNRGNFLVQKFAEKYNLGNAVAGNFYVAQHDNPAPKPHNH